MSRRPSSTFAVTAALLVLAAIPSTPAGLGAATTSAPPARTGAPVAARRPVSERDWGVTIRDDYRWLENWSDPAVRAWVDGQNVYTRSVLDRLPSRAAILARARELTQPISPHYSGLVHAGAGFFASKDQPPLQQPVLVWLPADGDPAHERVLLDPNAIDRTGAVSMDFFRPSPDGARVAVSLSRGGTEAGDVHVVDVASGHEIGEVVPHVNGGTAGGDVGWDADGRGFLYTRYPAKGERPDADLDFYQQVWHHRIGTPVASDSFVIGREFPKIAEIAFRVSSDGRWRVIEVKNGDGGQIGYWLCRPDGAIVPVAGFDDRIAQSDPEPDGLYLLSRATDLKGAIVRVPYDAPRLASAKVVVPPGADAIQSFLVAGKRLYVRDILGGPSQVRMFDTGGHPLGTLPLRPVSAVSGMVAAGGDDAWLETQSYTEPPRWVHVHAATGALSDTRLAMRSPADFSDVDVRREFAVSKDGTRVPMTVLIRRGVRQDGTAPLLLYGYGGYGISQSPDFQPIRRLWLEQGGIWVVANIRGGGEYGDAWHRDGMLTKKQHDYDDFAAVASWLVAHHYTSPARLVSYGASNGGLLMGVMITQQPRLFRAVVSNVGIYDMLHVEDTPNGRFNITEYGTVKDSLQFRALLGYSPLHHVRDGVTYPSVMLMTGANDPRVAPYNSFKFAARLRSSGTKRPVLLRTDLHTGHIGVPHDAVNERYADMFGFLFDQIGTPYRPVARATP